ncbi:MAG: glycosyltransferase family 4 protein [Prolixibacteraceae bacterium]|nr:glycosyltransferase family 4 protein [Prolixibacteraceae bacterium]MBN2649060.1 glycosyltransferase family 4 protein [Prolixibacteraceae bacterium]
MIKNLNIVSFNIPAPADYGGVIDVFYRIQALSKAGVRVYLHCFQYGRAESPELEAMCEKVFYYPRPRTLFHQFSFLPFIVNTRKNNELLKNLLQNDYPILFEGLHTCYYLTNKKLRKRVKIVRSHNIEHHYYSGLAARTSHGLKKIYFSIEARRLKRFERVYRFADRLGAISESDFEYLGKKYGKKVFLMPPSHPNNEVKSLPGRGDFILYQGNLEVEENREAALFVIERIAPNVDFQFVIAGKNPCESLVVAAQNQSNVRLVANPNSTSMDEMIANAHINFLPTFQSTGFKLKLINALFNGRFCVGTRQLVAGTGLGDMVVCCASDAGLIRELKWLITQEFTNDNIEKRKALLKEFSNSASVSRLLNMF